MISSAFAMAPIATQTPLSQEEAVVIPKHFGSYKEQAAGAKTFNKKLEEEGDIDRPRANVGIGPTLGYVTLTKYCSISIIFRNGIQT